MNINVSIRTYIQDFPYIDYSKNDYWVNLDDSYCKEVYKRQYRMNSGFIYGGISFIIDGENRTEILSTDDLHSTWLDLMLYYSNYTFNYKEKFIIFMGHADNKLVNNADKDNPHVRLIYDETSTEWILVSIMKQAVLDGFLHFMQIIDRSIMEDLYDEDGDPFDFPVELKDLLHLFDSLVE